MTGACFILESRHRATLAAPDTGPGSRVARKLFRDLSRTRTFYGGAVASREDITGQLRDAWPSLVRYWLEVYPHLDRTAAPDAAWSLDMWPKPEDDPQSPHVYRYGVVTVPLAVGGEMTIGVLFVAPKGAK